jgi:penicillin amidase
MLVDVSDWNSARMINTPGQSADPTSPYYKNLFELWAKNGYFPAYYSENKIKSVTKEVLLLKPSGKK